MRLNVDEINAQSPYWVIQLDDMLFRFITKNGVKYRAGFFPDTYFLKEGAYHFFLERVDADPGKPDEDVFTTVSLIIEEFFRHLLNVMLYICDPTDNREQARFRLYRQWFESFKQHDAYIMTDAAIQFEGATIYAGMIIRKDHPAQSEILDAFDAFVHLVPYDHSIVGKNPNEQ